MSKKETPDYMINPINDELQAKKFICDMFFDKNLFHFASSAFDIVNIKNERAFTDKQAELINKRVEEVFKYIEDPFQLCLALIESKYEVIV